MDFKRAFDDWAEASKVAFDDDRMATIGGSEIGGCARQIGYKKSGTPVDNDYVETQGFAARGNVMEDNALVPVVRRAVEAVGGKLLWAGQAEQMRLVNEVKQVSTTPDGLAINMPRDCLAKYGVADITNGDGYKFGEVYVELKSIDPRVSEAKLPKDAHVDQVNLGMGLVRDTDFGDGVVYQPNYAIIVYMNASDYSIITVSVVAFDPEGYRGQLLRAKNLMTAAASGPAAVEALRPEAAIAGGKDCAYCAFSKRCLGYTALVPKYAQTPDKKVVKKIRKLAGMLKSTGDKIDVLKKKSQTAEADLKETLIEARTKFVEAEGVKVNWSVSSGQERFDTDAAKKKLVELGLDLKDFIKVTKPSERLNVEYVNKLSA